MDKTVERIVGLSILIGFWFSFMTIPFSDKISDEVFYLGTLLGLGLIYSLLHQKKYPVQVILVVIAVEFILKQLEGQGVSRVLFNFLVINVNLYLGTLFAVFGPHIAKVFTSVLSPLQRYFNSIGLKMSIPVIAGILAFIITYFLFVSDIIYI